MIATRHSENRLPMNTWLKILILVVGCGALLTASAQPSGSFLDTRSEEYLNVVGVIPMENEAFKDRIVIFFDDRLVLPASEGIPELEPFTIEPALTGDFTVLANAVSYVPKSVSPEHVFRITVHPRLRSSRGLPVNPAHREFYVASALFRPKRLWTIQESPDGAVIGLLFSLPPDSDVLPDYVTVQTTRGERVGHSIEMSDNDKTFRIILENVLDWPVEITVRKGLPDKTGWFQTTADFKKLYPAQAFVTVKALFWVEIGPDYQTFRIDFSTLVSADELDRCLRIVDRRSGRLIPRKVTSGGRSKEHIVTLSLPNPDDVDLIVEISPWRSGRGGATLHEVYSGSLTRHIAPLTFRYTSWRHRGKKGMALYVRLSREIGDFATTKDLLEYLEITPELPDMSVEYHSYRTDAFYVYGGWEEEQTYELTLKEGLPVARGARLSKPITRFVKVDRIPSWVGFGYEGRFYLPRRDGLLLPIQTRRAPEVYLTLYRLFPSNIAVALKDMRSGQGSTWFNRSWCEEIAKKKITISGKPSALVTTPINLDEIFPSTRRGVFCLEAKPSRGNTATKMIVFTDIGLLAHWRDEEIVVFAHDLFSLSPLESAKITVFSDKNQVLGDARTDSQGIAYLRGMNTHWGQPVVIVAEQGNDFTFLHLTPRDEGSQEIRQDMPEYNRDGYDAFIYGDRDLYRPGETVHLRWIVRTNYGDAAGGVPLMLEIVKPNGKLLVRQPTTLSSFGTGSIDLATQKIYPTGLYRVELRVPGSEKSIGSYSFHLEEFVPHRMKAEVGVSRPLWLPGREYEIWVRARHLFGAPASDRKCEAVVYFRRGEYESRKWSGYRFDNDSSYVPSSISLGEARTDSQGDAEFSFSYLPDAEVTFPMTARVVGRVFELGGRAVSSATEVVVWPSDVLLGISASGREGATGLEVDVAAIAPGETPAPLEKVYVTLERQVWNYYVRRYYGNNQPRWSKSMEEVETREVPLLEGRGSTQFDVEEYGYYRVRVHSDQTPQYSTVSLFCYDGRWEEVDIGRPSLIKLSLDKPEYTVGENAVLRIESPFDGLGIIVIQGEKIERMMSVPVRDNMAVVEIPLTESEYPNVWVEVTVIHPVSESKTQVYPYSSFAVINLPMENPKRRIDVSITDLPEEIRPGETAEFLLVTRDQSGQPVQAELTLAAVDEGIHAITQYKSPDPYGWFGRSRKPDFQRAHYYDNVVFDFEKAHPAGDGFARRDELAKRLAPTLENWIKPVALWSGTVLTDEEGRATVTLDIPEFSGQFRLVAVACTADAAGSFSGSVFVRRPHMLRTSVPRFMLPGDSAQCRAVIFNHTEEPCKSIVKWSARGAFQETGGKMVIDVPSHGENTVLANVIAGKASGQGEISWEIDIMDPTGEKIDRLVQTSPIPVFPPAAFQSYHETWVLRPDEILEIRNERFLNNEQAEILLTVGANPVLELENALSYVVGYPYGCIEQTMSRLMPLYLLRQHAALVDSVLGERRRLDSYIRSGIDRLFAMQTRSGGLGFWPGAGEAYPYGSIYALHFLTLVKNDRQIEIPSENYESLRTYVRGLLARRIDDSQSALYEKAYTIYALALGGDLGAIQQISMFDDVVMPRAARYLLAAALARNTRDRDRVSLYLAETPSAPYLVTETAGSLNSDIRNTAVELMALEEMGGDPALMAEKAHRLTRFLRNNRHGTTQETAFIISALSSYLSRIGENIENAAARIDYSFGDRVRSSSISGGETYKEHHKGPGGAFTVENTGETDLVVNITTRGIPKTLVTEPVRQGITITRFIYSDDGRKLDGYDFYQGENYVIELLFSCGESLKNVVIADLLPGGFEIENPRLDPDAVPKGKFSAAVTPSHLEIRDDRLILAYDRVSKGTHHFYYAVRAVTPGSYRYPAVEAECMYDPAVRGSSRVRTIQVR